MAKRATASARSARRPARVERRGSVVHARRGEGARRGARGHRRHAASSGTQRPQAQHPPRRASTAPRARPQVVQHAIAPAPAAPRRRWRPRRAARVRGAGRRAKAAEKPGHVVTSPFVGTFYRSPVARLAAVRRGRQRGEEGPGALHRRGDEADERDRGRGRRHGRRDPGRERHAGRVRPAAVPDRDRRSAMFKKVLIANRGEIALRVIRACRELGLSTVAVHSTADAEALHVRFADEAVCIGPPPSKDSYLNIRAILSAAEVTGADAIHPGYGFLSENAKFAEVCENCGSTSSARGPRCCGYGQQGRAREAAEKAGLPLLPGARGTLKDSDEAERIANEIGFPVILKAAAGGGGRGMKIVRELEHVRKAFETASAEAAAAFGNGAHVPRALRRGAAPHRDPDGRRRARQRDPPRRARVLGAAPPPEDDRGGAVARRSRPSCARRWASAPSKALQDIGYNNVGTIEFLMDENGRFYFMEMNTRIQVEHPVTELVTGSTSCGTRSSSPPARSSTASRRTCRPKFHAIECRVNAEDPVTFAPSPGQDHRLPPAGRLRGARRLGRVRAVHGAPLLRLDGREAHLLGRQARGRDRADEARARRVRDRGHPDQHPVPEARARAPGLRRREVRHPHRGPDPGREPPDTARQEPANPAESRGGSASAP